MGRGTPTGKDGERSIKKKKGQITPMLLDKISIMLFFMYLKLTIYIVYIYGS